MTTISLVPHDPDDSAQSADPAVRSRLLDALRSAGIPDAEIIEEGEDFAALRFDLPSGAAFARAGEIVRAVCEIARLPEGCLGASSGEIGSRGP